jgi:hypothetical protein
MDQPEHIHIISAGSDIHKTCPVVLVDLLSVTLTVISAEKWDLNQLGLV